MRPKRVQDESLFVADHEWMLYMVYRETKWPPPHLRIIEDLKPYMTYSEELERFQSGYIRYVPATWNGEGDNPTFQKRNRESCNALEAAGLIETIKGPRNRRFYIRLTAKGMQIAEKLAKKIWASHPWHHPEYEEVESST